MMTMEQTEAEEKIGFLSNQKKLPRKGGLRTMPFIIVNESFEKVSSNGLMPNMIFYLMNGYHMKAASASSILFLWSAISNAMSLFGAFLSDSYLGRFWVIALGSISSLLGMTLLWLTAMIPQMKPEPCDQFQYNCNSATAAQFAVLFTSFGLISIGAGCIRPCSMAFGADQLENKKEGPDYNERVLQSFFNWYYATTGLSIVLALTIIVYIQDHLGWVIGFGVPAILMLFSVFMFLVGSSLYIKVKAGNSLFTGFVQVLTVAFKNRKLSIPTYDYDDYCHHNHDSEQLALTDNLRCLNKACFIKDPLRDLNSDNSPSNQWRLCTVEQVESLKSLLRVIPIWSTGFTILASLNQGSFSTLQANTMNRHITPNFEIPAGSFFVFTVINLTIWLAFYDRVIVPLLAKHTEQPHGLSPKSRMGIGLVLSCIAMPVSAVTECIRRRKGTDEEMSAMWLVPQYAIFGLAESFNAVGQIQFYYSEFPKSMASIAVALFTFGMAMSNLFGSFLVNIVNFVTTKGGKESWLSSNLNKGHLDYYYWLLTLLGLINFVYFLVCCRLYGPTKRRKY